MRRRNEKTHLVAVTAMLSAVSLVILYLSALAPTARLGVVAIAGLVPAAAVISVALKSGVYCYAVTSILGIFLVPDKNNVIVYILFLGLYPVVKCFCERAKNVVVGWGLKLLFFNIMLCLFWFGLRAVIAPFLPATFDTWWIVIGGGNVVFIIYDMGFTKLIGAYISKVDKHLRK